MADVTLKWYRNIDSGREFHVEAGSVWDDLAKSKITRVKDPDSPDGTMVPVKANVPISGPSGAATEPAKGKPAKGDG